MKQGSQSESQSERIRESVSALMDGEAEALELRRVLSQEHQVTVDETWRRYHLVREAMVQDSDTVAFRHVDISARVSAALADEPILEQKLHAWWYKPVAGFAVAASVAAAVVIGVQGNGEQQMLNPVAQSPATLASSRVYPQAAGSLQASTGSVPVPVAQGEFSAPQLPGAVVASQKLSDMEARKRFDKYLLRHTQQAALNNGQGMISFARVASFENE